MTDSYQYLIQLRLLDASSAQLSPVPSKTNPINKSVEGLCSL